MKLRGEIFFAYRISVVVGVKMKNSLRSGPAHFFASRQLASLADSFCQAYDPNVGLHAGMSAHDKSG